MEPRLYGLFTLDTRIRAYPRWHARIRASWCNRTRWKQRRCSHYARISARLHRSAPHSVWQALKSRQTE